MWKIYDEDERLFAVKNLLADGVSVASSNRDTSVNEVSKSASLQVRSYFCNGDLSWAPKILRLKRRGFRPILF